MAEYEPWIVERGSGCYLIDVDGNRYLDGVSSLWCNVHGHRHPKLDAAVRAQLDRIAHCTSLGASNPTTIELAHRLVDIAPAGLNHVFFSDDGATAVEVALKMAFQYWRNIGQPQRQKFIGFSDSYHGDTIGVMSLGARSVYNQLFDPLLFPIESAPFPSTFIGDTQVEHKEKQALLALEKIVCSNLNQYAAIIIEPLVQGAGGMNFCRPEFLKKLREFADQADILLIFDEVMTGFGRTGKLFACDHPPISPDIICLSNGSSAFFWVKNA